MGEHGTRSETGSWTDLLGGLAESPSEEGGDLASGQGAFRAETIIGGRVASLGDAGCSETVDVRLVD